MTRQSLRLVFRPPLLSLVLASLLLTTQALYAQAPAEGDVIRKSTGEVYLIDGGRRRHVPDLTSLEHYGLEDLIVDRPDAVVDGVPLGQALPSVASSFIKRSTGQIYHLEAGKRRHIQTMAKLAKMLDETSPRAAVRTISDSDMDAIPLGIPIYDFGPVALNFEVKITALEPPQPLEAQAVTIAYRLRNAGKGVGTGKLAGELDGVAVATSDVSVQLAPGAETQGTLNLGSIGVGSHTITIAYMGLKATRAFHVQAYSPRFNEVLQKASHNSFDNAESLFDQLVYHRVRHLDIDLHVSHLWREPIYRDWWVYHHDVGSVHHGWLHTFSSWDGTRCATARGCLGLIRAFHDAVPDHEVVTLTFELSDDDFVNDGNHGPAEFDQLVREVLLTKDESGRHNVFAPADLLARCSDPKTLQEAVGSSLANGCAWPRLNELRGKFILLMMNDESYFDPNAPPEAGKPDGPAWSKRLAFKIRTGVNTPGAESADPNLLFYGTVPQTAGSEPGAYFFRKHLITRIEWQNSGFGGDWTYFYGADHGDIWARSVAAGIQILSTNAFNEHRNVFSKTHNAFGYPFACVPLVQGCDVTKARESIHAFELHVASDDMAGTADSLVFDYSDFSSAPTGEWTAAISTASSEVDEWARGCLSARQSMSPSSPHFSVCKAADTKGLFVQVRAEGCGRPCGTAHGDANLENSMARPPAGTLLEEDAAFVKLVLQHDARGTHASAYGSFDGRDGSWRPIVTDGRVVWDFPGALPLQGLAATSHGTGNRNPDGSLLRFVFVNVRRNGAPVVGPGAFTAFQSIGRVTERRLVVDGEARDAP